MRNPIHWPSVWQFALSSLAIFNLLSAAMLLAVAALAGVFIQQGAFADPLPMFLMAAGSAVSGLLLVPSAFYALARLIGKQVEPPSHVLRKLRPAWWVLALPAVILLGYLVAQYPRVTWLLLPFLHVLAIGLPILWLLWLAVRGLPLGSPQRMWGVFDSGLVLGPALIAVVEIFAALAYQRQQGERVIATRKDPCQ